MVIKRDKLEEEKKKLEHRAENYIGEKKAKVYCYKIIKRKELHVEELQKELAEANRKNRLLEDFIEKSLVNQEKCANNPSKVETISKPVQNDMSYDIGK